MPASTGRPLSTVQEEGSHVTQRQGRAIIAWLYGGEKPASPVTPACRLVHAEPEGRLA